MFALLACSEGSYKQKELNIQTQKDVEKLAKNYTEKHKMVEEQLYLFEKAYNKKTETISAEDLTTLLDAFEQ